MRALEFVTGHVIFKLRYNQIYQLKTTPSDIINSEQPKYENSTTEKVYVYECLRDPGIPFAICRPQPSLTLPI